MASFQGIQDAPVFEISEKEYRNPMEFINRIRKFAENQGICKIKLKVMYFPLLISAKL